MSEPAATTTWLSPVPVSLSLTLGALRRGPGDPTQQIGHDGALWRTLRTPAGPATLRLVALDREVQAAAWGSGAGWALAQVPALLGADDDLSGFAPGPGLVADTWRRLPHLRLPRLGLVFELLVPAVLEQRVTGREARDSWRTLLRRYGEPAPGPETTPTRLPLLVFPAPEVWRRIPSWEWHRANVDPNRARAIVTAAADADRLEASLAKPVPDRLRRLRAIPGIGRWTAAEVAQRAWGDPDEVSYGDYHTAALVGWALLGKPVDDDAMMDLLAAYPGHRQRAVRLIELSGASKPRFGPRMPAGDIRHL